MYPWSGSGLKNMTGQWGFKDGMSPAKVVTVVLSCVMAGAGSGWGGRVE